MLFLNWTLGGAQKYLTTTSSSGANECLGKRVVTKRPCLETWDLLMPTRSWANRKLYAFFLLQTNTTNRCLASTQIEAGTKILSSEYWLLWVYTGGCHTLECPHPPDMGWVTSTFGKHRIKDLWAFSSEPRHRTAGMEWESKEKMKRKRRIWQRQGGLHRMSIVDTKHYTVYITFYTNTAPIYNLSMSALKHLHYYNIRLKLYILHVQYC